MTCTKSMENFEKNKKQSVADAMPHHPTGLPAGLRDLFPLMLGAEEAPVS